MLTNKSWLYADSKLRCVNRQRSNTPLGMLIGVLAQRTERLLAFARALLRADTFAALLQVTRSEVRASTGYNNVWLMVGEKEDPAELQLVQFEGTGSDEHVREIAPRLTVRGDRLLECAIASDAPTVVVDARTDPRTDKYFVEQLQNRTIVGIPLRLVEKPFGIFCTGTFGDEGCRAPTEAELDYLLGIASQIAVAASRIMLEESRARQAHETRYRMLFENMNAAFGYHSMIFEGDKPVDYLYLEVNQAFERMTGLKRENVVGKRASEVMPGIRDFKPDLIALYGKVIETGESAQFEVDYTPLGRSYSIAVHSPVPDHFVTVFTDISETRLRAQALAASNLELEAFSYSVSHDLQAPLRSIASFSQILLEDYADKLDETGKHYLERVIAGAQHMSKLIEALLKLSRVSRAEMTWTAVDLSEIARVVTAGLQAAEPNRAVTFEIEPGLQAMGDPVLLQQVLQNLLGNAFKFTSHHATAHIHFGQEPRSDEQILFVRDDGAGFDMASAKKLFGTFERLHNAQAFPGTGIGLALVQRIVRKHGGRIWAESAVEQGATFYFTLSRAQPSS